MTVKACRVKGDRLAAEKRSMAFAAIGRLAETLGWNAIDGIAMRADDV